MAIPEVRPLQVGPSLMARMILLGPWVNPTGRGLGEACLEWLKACTDAQSIGWVYKVGIIGLQVWNNWAVAARERKIVGASENSGNGTWLRNIFILMCY